MKVDARLQLKENSGYVDVTRLFLPFIAGLDFDNRTVADLVIIFGHGEVAANMAPVKAAAPLRYGAEWRIALVRGGGVLYGRFVVSHMEIAHLRLYLSLTSAGTILWGDR